MHHVEHAAIERHQRDQQQIGKRDPRQFDRQTALRGIIGKARRQDGDRLRHEQPGYRQQHDLRDEQQREDAIGEQPRRGLAAAAEDMGIGRNESGVESALGKDRTKTVRQAERHEKRVRNRPGAEDRRKHDIARKAGKPRKERIAADREDTSEHQRLLQHAAALQNGEIMPNFVLRMILSENRMPLSGDHAPSAPRTALMTRSCVASSR